MSIIPAEVQTAVEYLKDHCYQDVALVPSTSLDGNNKRWATSDLEDGSIEFMTDAEVIEGYKDMQSCTWDD